MNRFCARMFGLTLFVFLVLAVAVQPAIAQLYQAKHIHHRLLPAGDTCASCHKAIYDQWKASPHAANGVECTVCHGETTAPDFAGTPALSACDNCHTDQLSSSTHLRGAQEGGPGSQVIPIFRRGILELPAGASALTALETCHRMPILVAQRSAAQDDSEGGTPRISGPADRPEHSGWSKLQPCHP
jgi:hypothetical protein